MAFSRNTASDGTVITKSDTTPVNFQAVYVGGAGTVNVETVKGSTVSFTAVAGATLHIKVVKVLSTGTSATLLVGLND